MGLFNKIKNMFKGQTEENEKVEQQQSTEIVEKDQKEEEKSTIIVEKSEKKHKKEDKQKEEVKIYEKGLTKSREGFVSRLANLTNKYAKVNEEYFEELEEILIMADIGVNTVMEFMDRLRDRVKKEKIDDPELLKELIVDELFIIYVNDEVLVNKINYAENGPTIILFVGVNGVGKTTTIGKLAYNLKSEGKKVLLVGADTFRAGAIEQLNQWGEKIGVDFYSKEEGNDPSSVVYDGVEKAKNEDYDVVLIDTDNSQAIEEFDFYNNEKNFFVTAFDCYSLKRGLETLDMLKMPIELTKILYSTNMLKEEDDYLNFLSLEKKIRWDDYRIYFPMSNEDMNAIAECQRAQKMLFRKLSNQYKEGLIYVTQEIEKDINESQIRRVVKNLEKGV